MCNGDQRDDERLKIQLEEAKAKRETEPEHTPFFLIMYCHAFINIINILN